MKTIELLAPAKNLSCGIAAIDCGADAVYIGAGQFGAREKAANSLDDIAVLVDYAHTYWARVYCAINTLLYDHEIPIAVKLIEQLDRVNIDGIIIQDIGLLECDLPPVPLIASTQMHNHTPERVAFLEQIGFHRVVLARELSLRQIHAIRKAAPSIELEFFVHGALCVSYSGQCYLSYAAGGRSANRGQCAQPCRKPYRLAGDDGRIIAPEKYFLSLNDFNASGSINDLIDAGITSFKIEGRLKEEAYVKNIVGHYRILFDHIFKRKGLRKRSSGSVTLGFTPDVNKTFNRGYTSYFLQGKKSRIASIDTPKMTGPVLGKVSFVDHSGFKLSGQTAPVHSGDGICFFDRRHRLRGASINTVQNALIVPDSLEGIETGMTIYRNVDHEFIKQVTKSRSMRRIAVRMQFTETAAGFKLTAVDEDDVSVEVNYPAMFEAAEKRDRARETIIKQWMKTGDSVFKCTNVDLLLKQVPFIPIQTLNQWRRDLLVQLVSKRRSRRPCIRSVIRLNDIPYPERSLSYQGNVLNRYAGQFYRRHGVEAIEPAAESGIPLRRRKVMTTRYCLRNELRLCSSDKARNTPLFLIDQNNRRLRLQFDCNDCGMEIFLED